MLLVCLTAFFAAGLTLFSGFGLGSILLPAFALFFPLKAAVAATAVVHLLNNVFKAGMLGRHARLRVVLVFGLPAMVAAFGGAALLDALSGSQALATWNLGDRVCPITPDGLVIGGLVGFFALFELWPRSREVGFGRGWLSFGGALSGFLGGLSGHQGALRTAFLIRQGLSKEAFLGTGILCAILIDVTRIGKYLATESSTDFALIGKQWDLVLGGTLCALLGSYIGRRLMTKVKMEAIHLLVGVLLAVLGVAIGVGIV
ncbi:MAG: sulfite exporter TauE/SafE family protein [Planctomycetota bacterium]|jgi:hypothetical protein|nr:sulfite exporter TauE/SafE family protein [Planctomycetota bacterium]